MRTNIRSAYPFGSVVATHEGAPAKRITPEQELRRSVLACMLWENEFYEDGKTIADRIVDLSARVKPEVLAALAVEARHQQHLRHVPLLLCVALLKHGKGSLVGDTIGRVVSRADEPGELIALYWKSAGNKKMLPAQLKRGLRIAFGRFTEYHLAKYGGNH